MTRPEPHPLLRACRDPAATLQFTPSDWNRCLLAARSEGLHARLGYRLADAGLLAACPGIVQDLFLAARAYPIHLHTQVTRELRHVRRSLETIGADLILLKGAAYLSAELPLSRGRRLKDLDILVRRETIGDVERQLKADGWESQVTDAYDQRYYREWMHEIPPLRHQERHVEVDVHHTLLPLTSRLRPDPHLFWQSALPLHEQPGVSVLDPLDMVLHTAAHLFYDGVIRGGLNDLWDIDALLRHFASKPGFWPGLIARARQTDLGRPLYYGLVFAEQLMGTPVPHDALADAASQFASPAWSDRAMRVLVPRALAPQDGEEAKKPFSNWLLLVRSHWLRMPPDLLIPHLARKGLRRLGKRRESADPRTAP